MNIFKKIYWKTDLFLDTVGEALDDFKLFVWGIFAPKQLIYYYNLYHSLKDMTDEAEEQYEDEIVFYRSETEKLRNEIAELKNCLAELEK